MTTKKSKKELPRYNVLRGAWFAEAFEDGRVGVIIQPEEGQPAGMVLDAIECARMAQQLWRLAGLAQRDAKAKKTRRAG